MRFEGFTAWALVAGLGLLGPACSSESSADDGAGTDDGNTDDGNTDDGDADDGAVLEVPDGAGATPKAAYPAAPYGVGVDSVITDMSFIGYTRASTDRADLEVVSLSDFYNPTGADLYPMDGRAWQGQAKPKVVALSVSAAWCPPCKEEWRTVVPEKRAQIGAGGEFVLLMSDGNAGAVPPVISEIDAWSRTFEIVGPVVLDATLVFEPVWESNAYPQNVLVRTSDMVIVAKSPGVPLESYWTLMNAIANAP